MTVPVKQKLNEILPGRVPGEVAAEILGFSTHDVPVLIRAGHLRPLGKPAQNGPKYFATTELMMLATNRAWLDKATKIVTQTWKEKNHRRHRPSLGSSDSSESSTVAPTKQKFNVYKIHELAKAGSEES